MKKTFLLMLMLVAGLAVDAKTTYIPKYKSYIHIVNGTDTVAVSGNTEDLELSDNGGMFKIYVEHENITAEKVKAIKRAKRAAGWASFSAVMSGVSTALSDNSLQYMVRSTNTQIASQLADIYTRNANAEQRLKIDLLIENTTKEELMINDMERGLTWYIKPSQFFYSQLNNPDVANLRISSIHNDHVRYAVITAGSLARKKAIAWEDDECWISAVMTNESNAELKTIEKYLRISKTDYTESDMSIEEFKAYKKEKKNR